MKIFCDYNFSFQIKLKCIHNRYKLDIVNYFYNICLACLMLHDFYFINKKERNLCNLPRLDH